MNSVGSNPKYDKLRTASDWTGRTSNSLEPRFVYQNRTLNPFKPLQKPKPKFEYLWPEMGQAQI